MNNINLGTVLVVIGIVCFVLAAFSLSISVNLWFLGWAFVVAGWLLGNSRTA